MAIFSSSLRGALWGMWGALLAFLISYLFYSYYTCPYIQWNGGTPGISQPGSCWCGADEYCLCTPSLAIDAIIEVTALSIEHHDIHIVLVQRRDSTEVIHAIPGGFVDIGETVEHATIREVKEETNLDISDEKMEQFRVYSDPTRDSRRHTVSAVFRCRVSDISEIKRGDDAKAVVIVSLKKALASYTFAFDHKKILEDYVSHYYPGLATHIPS